MFLRDFKSGKLGCMTNDYRNEALVMLEKDLKI